jgi:general stress protein 26
MRTLKQRRDDTLAKLTHGKRDVWVATEDRAGRPHLVPFSFGWDGQNIVVATEAHSRTVHNLRASGLARLAVGDTRDVVLIDTHVTEAPINELDSLVADSFQRRNGWDPRHSSTPMVWLVCKPDRILTWQDEAELEGRTIMKLGRWLT